MAVDGVDSHCCGMLEKGNEAVNKHQIQPEYEERPGCRGIGQTNLCVPRYQSFRRENGIREISFSLFSCLQAGLATIIILGWCPIF